MTPHVPTSIRELDRRTPRAPAGCECRDRPDITQRFGGAASRRVAGR